MRDMGLKNFKLFKTHPNVAMRGQGSKFYFYVYTREQEYPVGQKEQNSGQRENLIEQVEQVAADQEEEKVAATQSQ